MHYAKIEKNSIANGPGIRVVLWCQGCSIHCKGCHNPETWDFNDGIEYTPIDEKTILDELKKDYVDGITFSGGHPIEPDNLLHCYLLADRIKIDYPLKTIWIYTGLTLEMKDFYNLNTDNYFDYIKTKFLRLCDVVVDGPFIEEQRDISLPYCGSRNQRLIDVKKTLENNRIEIWENN